MGREREGQRERDREKQKILMKPKHPNWLKQIQICFCHMQLDNGKTLRNYYLKVERH